MKLLLDTHSFLWYITNDARLPAVASDAIREKSNDVHLSVVSVWEVLVKAQIGKLAVPEPADEYLRDRRERHQIASLPIEEASLSYLLKLPLHHRDPFDRMLICQALYYDLTIVTVDEWFAGYGVKILARLRS